MSSLPFCRAPAYDADLPLLRPPPVLRVFVTCNAEQYRVIDISGAQDGARIRERIFTKVCVPDSGRPRRKLTPLSPDKHPGGTTDALQNISVRHRGLRAQRRALRCGVVRALPPTRRRGRYPQILHFYSTRPSAFGGLRAIPSVSSLADRGVQDTYDTVLQDLANDVDIQLARGGLEPVSAVLGTPLSAVS